MASLLHICCEGCGCCPVLSMDVDQFASLRKHHPEIAKEFLQFKVSFIYCRQINSLVICQANDSKINFKKEE
ncbi:MAG: hypothetical protein Q8O93_04245 [bacterium]|nr:hypothetical protein [bacterium]